MFYPFVCLIKTVTIDERKVNKSIKLTAPADKLSENSERVFSDPELNFQPM